MKRIFSVLLVAALLLTIPVMPVFAETNTTVQEENVTPLTDACPCGCGKTVQEIEWTPLPTGYMGSAPEGHHYMTEDYFQGNYGTTIIAGTNVVIDLRGHTWGSSTNKDRLFTVQGNLTIMDTVGGGKLAPMLRGAWGGAFLLDTYETANPTLRFASGTITAATGSGDPKTGGVIYAMEDSRFIMTGGVIENITVSGDGGVVHTSGTATVQILGGVIRNCSAGAKGGVVNSIQPVTLKNTTFVNCTAATNGGVVRSSKKITVENCTFMGCTATGIEADADAGIEAAAGNGGAIYASAGLAIKSSKFIGNSATNGGDIYITGSTASTIDGSMFYGGYSTLNGGSIMASSAKLTITDSQFTGSVADKQGGTIYQSGGTLTITGSELNGGISNWEGSVYCGGGNLFMLSSATATITDSTLRNGFAKVYGGNIAMAGSTLTLNNTTVTGGVAKLHGNNIGCQNACTVTINGGTIDGDIYIPAGKPITLEGLVTIGLRNNGLALGANANVDASGLTAGSEVYISGTGTLVAAGADLSYFKGAIRTTLSGGGTAAITGTAGETGYCPHCLASVTWTAYAGETASGHYYMTDSVAADTAYSYTGGADVVLDLNGKTISDTSGRALTTSVTGGATKLSILDSAGNSMVKSYGPSTTYNGGVIFNNGTLNIYGGNFINTDKGYVKGGGILWNNGTANIYGGFFDGSNYENTTADAGFGGVIGNAATKTLKITAGHFVGGKAYMGGTLYVATNSNNTISGGTFVDGTASSSGGNIYAVDGAAGSFTMTNAIIRDGSSASNAGNIRVGKFTSGSSYLSGCFIADGAATGTGAYGGNISVVGANTTFIDCVISGGTSAGTGGNVYTAGIGSAVVFNGCLITGGTATNNGGNCYFNHGTHQILGGEISYGKARVGANIYSNAGNHASGSANKITIRKNSAGEIPQIFNGMGTPTATNSSTYGGNITVVGVMELTDAVIYGGSANYAGKDIQLTTGSVRTKLTIGSGVTGGRSGAISMSAPVSEPIYGTTIANTVCTELNAKIVLEGDYGNPNILAKDGVLVVAGAKGYDANGNEVWYADYDEAAAATGSDRIVTLYADATLNLTKDTFVDLNGYTATVSGSGKLLGLDSTGDDYSLPAGKVTFTGTSPVADKSIVYAPNGNKYVALVGDGEVTFHRLGADLTSVTINIDKNAVYFKGKFGADDTLKALIDTYGIAVSLSGMPDERLTDAMMSTYQGTDLTNGEIASGVYITNIIRDDLTFDQNNNRGQDKIYATAYVTLTDGTTTFISDQSNTESDDIAWSLCDAFNRLDQLIDEDPTNFRRYTTTMREYYAKWKDKGIKDWVGEDTNFVEPEDDGVIDILMIGSSACYYYVEEMASLAEAAGIKLRVCNVYYSGCPINKYYQDWLNNYADYQFFDTTAETLSDGTIKATRKALGGGKTLEWCLAQGEWDVISMQTRGALVMRDYFKGVDHLEASDIKEASEFMFRYVKSQFPNAHFYLKEFWASQAGKNGTYGGTYWPIEGLEQQTLYTTQLKNAADRMAVKFADIEMRVMRDGEAWQLVREAGYDKLCARVGFRPDSSDTSFDTSDPHEGDHGHDGDIGGGQYLNGALWLQTIMQNHYDADFDVRTIDWVPTYTYYNNVVANRFDAELLKECAYKAATVGWTPPAN